MNRHTHIAFLAVAALGGVVGAALWSKWGATIWLTGFAIWCG